jgi:DHA2 family multidrug resistance protein
LQQHYQQLGYGMFQAKQQALADFYKTLQNQASMLSYLDIVVMLGVASLCMVPLVFLMQKPKPGAVAMH